MSMAPAIRRGSRPSLKALALQADALGPASAGQHEEK
jgi:hypothetical protein